MYEHYFYHLSLVIFDWSCKSIIFYLLISSWFIMYLASLYVRLNTRLYFSPSRYLPPFSLSLSVSMSVCECVPMSVCDCVCLGVCVCVRIWMRVYEYVWMCECVWVCVSVYTLAYLCLIFTCLDACLLPSRLFLIIRFVLRWKLTIER